MKIARVNELCQELGIRPSKKFGQNFLIDERICETIVRESLSNSYPMIYEIGPGLGALTDKILSERKDLQLIEFDKKIADYWKKREVKTYNEDAAKFDWLHFVKEKSVVVSNLPYQISSLIVINLSQITNVRKMVLMFQKEVAQRIVSKSNCKEYGLLSIVAQTYWQVEKVIDAPSRAFFPPPKIDSRVLKFVRIEGNQEKYPSDFVDFVKKAFSQRRKLLSKNIKSFAKDSNCIGEAFGKLSINEKARAEDLSVELFQKLYKELKNGNKNSN